MSVLPVSFNHVEIALSRRTLILRGIMILSWSSLCRINVWKTRPYSKCLMLSYPNHKDTTLWSITDHKRPHLFTYSHHRSSTTPSENFSPFCHTLLFVDNKYKLLIKKSRSKLTFKCNKKHRICNVHWLIFVHQVVFRGLKNNIVVHRYIIQLFDFPFGLKTWPISL